MNRLQVFCLSLTNTGRRGVWRSCLWCLGGAPRSILRRDMNILGPTGSLVTKGLMTVARHVLWPTTYLDGQAGPAKLWRLERWTKASSRHQPRLLRDPYLWRMAPIRRNAPPYFAVCQILAAARILRNCPMGVVAVLTRGQVQVVVVAKNWPFGDQTKREGALSLV